MSDRKKKKGYNTFALPVLSIGIVALLFSLITILIYLRQFGYQLTNEHERWAQFGDYVGGVLGSIFAFLALIALLLTLWLQNKELRNSAKALHESTEALKEQNRSIVLQNFENTFFQLLKAHTEITNDIVIAPTITNTNTPTITGRDCFEKFYATYKSTHRQYTDDHPDWDNEKIIKESYKEFYQTIQADTGHYFLFLYNILKYIFNADIDDKFFYSNLVRAQLSYNELALLFYNCLSVPDNSKMKPLIEYFSLFKNLPQSILINGESDVELYETEVFIDT